MKSARLRSKDSRLDCKLLLLLSCRVLVRPDYYGQTEGNVGRVDLKNNARFHIRRRPWKDDVLPGCHFQVGAIPPHQ